MSDTLFNFSALNDMLVGKSPVVAWYYYGQINTINNSAEDDGRYKVVGVYNHGLIIENRMIPFAGGMGSENFSVWKIILNERTVYQHPKLKAN